MKTVIALIFVTILFPASVFGIPESYSLNIIAHPSVSINSQGNYLTTLNNGVANKPVVKRWIDDADVHTWNNTGDWDLRGVELNDNNQVAARRIINNFGKLDTTYRLNPNPSGVNGGTWVQYQSSQTDSEPFGMNNLGQPVGARRQFTSSTPEPYVDNTGIPNVFYPCCNSSLVGGRGSSINDSGVVVGEQDVNYQGNNLSHAFVYDPLLPIISINEEAGYLNGSATANDINNNGLVVGEITAFGLISFSNRDPYLFDTQTNTLTILPSLPGGNPSLRPWTNEINDSGIVVGVWVDSNSLANGVVWESGNIFELTPLVPELDPGDRIDNAIDITNNGEILVRFFDASLGNQRYAVLVPESNSCASIFPLGDLNLDCEVNLGDSIIFNRYLTGQESLTTQQLDNADLDQDSLVNFGDLILLQRQIAGL